MSARARQAAAIQAARAGLSVFPVVPRGKKPLRKGWQRSATTDPAVVGATWAAVPDANIGVACGRGLVVVDTDSANADAAVREIGMPDTPTVRTAAGHHYYLSGAAGNRVGVIPGVDIRGAGGYVVGAGSQHPSGIEYRWVIPPWESSLSAIPAELFALIRARSVVDIDLRSTSIEDGTRNATLFRLASSLRGRYGFGFDEILAAIAEANRLRCRPPLDGPEVEKIARSAAAYASAPLWTTDAIAFARDPRLGARERILLMAIAHYADDKGVAWPGVRLLHADTGLAKDTIKRATDVLVSTRRLAVEKRSGTSNRYRLLPQEFSLGSSRADEGGSSVLPSRTVGGSMS